MTCSKRWSSYYWNLGVILFFGSKAYDRARICCAFSVPGIQRMKNVHVKTSLTISNHKSRTRKLPTSNRFTYPTHQVSQGCNLPSLHCWIKFLFQIFKICPFFSCYQTCNQFHPAMTLLRNPMDPM